MPGTISRGVRAPIIREGDDIVSIVVDSVLKAAKEDMIVLHPLPRVTEIDVDVDDDPRASYFYQALMGKYIRMALILYLLGIK